MSQHTTSFQLLNKNARLSTPPPVTQVPGGSRAIVNRTVLSHKAVSYLTSISAYYSKITYNSSDRFSPHSRFTPSNIYCFLFILSSEG